MRNFRIEISCNKIEGNQVEFFIAIGYPVDGLGTDWYFHRLDYPVSGTFPPTITTPMQGRRVIMDILTSHCAFLGSNLMWTADEQNPHAIALGALPPTITSEHIFQGIAEFFYRVAMRLEEHDPIRIALLNCRDVAAVATAGVVPRNLLWHARCEHGAAPNHPFIGANATIGEAAEELVTSGHFQHNGPNGGRVTPVLQ